jgi:hypothetical protein
MAKGLPFSTCDSKDRNTCEAADHITWLRVAATAPTLRPAALVFTGRHSELAHLASRGAADDQGVAAGHISRVVHCQLSVRGAHYRCREGPGAASLGAKGRLAQWIQHPVGEPAYEPRCLIHSGRGSALHVPATVLAALTVMQL